MENEAIVMENGVPTAYGAGIGFENIRRITGYLVGTLDTWNDAKKAEEKARVKHGTFKSEQLSA